MTAVPDKPLARIIPAADAQSWLDGYAMLARAHEEAENIRANINHEVSKAVDAGIIQGRRQGELAATQTVLHAQTVANDWLKMLEPAIIKLTSEVVYQVLGEQPDEKLVIRATIHALTAMRERQNITLSIAPELFIAVSTELGAKEGLRIVADRHLSGRRCLLSTPDSSMDISVDTQIDTIIKAMENAVSSVVSG